MTEKSNINNVDMLKFSKWGVCMNEDKKPLNDAIDHLNKIEGSAFHPSNADLNKLPKPLRFFGYFMITFFGISLLLVIILNLLN